MTKLNDFEARLIDGQTQPLSAYDGKVVLVVNTASQCGSTPQYDGLEKLYETYQDRGLVVLGFPCNQFEGQEPGTESEIAAFCRVNYDISFPMFGKIEVNGKNTHPLYKWLKRKAPGLLGVQLVKWNFTKFLIDRSGGNVQRFATSTQPQELVKPIEALL